MQALLAGEKEERGRIVVTLRETIASMKHAAEQEATLRQNLADMQEQLSTARAAEVLLSYPSFTRGFGLSSVNHSPVVCHDI